MNVDEAILADEDPLSTIKEWTNGDFATAVFDATGNVGSMNRRLGYVASGGKLVYAGLVQGEFSLPDPEFHRRETTLLASRNALASDFTSIIGHIEAGRIDTGKYRQKLAEAVAAGIQSRY